MPRSAQARNTAAVEASARSQASTLCCCEPTWNEMPCGDQPALVREFQDVGGIVRLAAELARQRPFGAGAVAMDAADHAAAGRGARDLLDLGLAVDGKQRDAEPEGGGDLALLLDGVAVGDALGRARRRRARPRSRCTEATSKQRAELGQQLEDFRRRIGLDGVEHLGVRQRLGEGQVVLAHDVEVEHQAGSVIGAVA